MIVSLKDMTNEGQESGNRKRRKHRPHRTEKVSFPAPILSLAFLRERDAFTGGIRISRFAGRRCHFNPVMSVLTKTPQFNVECNVGVDLPDYIEHPNRGTARMQRVFFTVVGVLTFFACNAACSRAQQLQYDFTKDQKTSYDYDIQIDTSGSLINYTGIVNYNVTAVTEQLVRLTFSGGLMEQTKVTSNRESDFGRIIPRPSVLPTIFTRNNFSGKTQSKNSISMTRSGQVLTLDGTSQLPFLLGNLSLIPFEQLPVEEKKTWRSDTGVSITDDSNAIRFTFRPFGPFAFQPAERMQLASELSQYTIARTEAGLVTVEKSYEMKTPDTGDRESFHMTGKGVWSFDTNDHFPSSTDMQYTLNIKDGNTTTTFPIKVKFTKLSE